MGFEEFWRIDFHTSDIDPTRHERLGPQVDRGLG